MDVKGVDRLVSLAIHLGGLAHQAAGRGHVVYLQLKAMTTRAPGELHRYCEDGPGVGG